MNRTVLVVGASRGIGRAIADAFIGDGDTVVAWSRSGDAPNGAVLSQKVDISFSNEVEEAVDQLHQTVGALDVIVINAGITDDGLVMRMKDEQWRDVLATNLDGAFFVAKRTLGDLIKKRAGSVIFISSVSPFLGIPGQANYAASKAGIVGLARSLAGEVARRGVTVNVIAPGLIDTDMTRDLAATKDVLLGRVPLGRIGEPADIAGVALFLASESSRYVTGAVIPVDGGLAMGL